MSDPLKDLSTSELADVKRQLQRIKALGEGSVTVTFKNHRLTNIGIFAEIAVSLDNPDLRELTTP